jgi:hypothetical protein
MRIGASWAAASSVAVERDLQRPRPQRGRLLVTGEILPCLQRLGATAEEVAATLAVLEVRARRGATTFYNPIVRHLNRTLDLGARLEIPLDSDILNVLRTGSWVRIPLPEPVVQFLTRFHAGEYPALELA